MFISSKLFAYAALIKPAMENKKAVRRVMKKTNGTANPKKVNEIIQEEIKKG